MEPVQNIIEIPNFIDLVDFLGPKDLYLNMIKKNIDIKIKLDNRKLYLFGIQEQVDKASMVFEKILEVLGTGEKVLSQDVDLYLRQAESGSIPEAANDIILKMGKTVVKAKTKHQKEYVDAIENNIITFAIGCAGTAKTYLAATTAVKALKEKQVSKIIITRSPIALEGYSMGYIPGTDGDKMAPWIAPLIDVFSKFYTPEKLNAMLESGVIEAVPMAYIRGRSFENCFIILDEAQNISINAFKSVMTRIGVGSKLVICGDTKQTDINGTSGLETAARIMEGADGVAIIRMSFEDIVRSGITAEVIKRFTEAGFQSLILFDSFLLLCYNIYRRKERNEL